jgi:hypothetical protein
MIHLVKVSFRSFQQRLTKMTQKRAEGKKISSKEESPSELGTPIKQLLPTPESKTSSSLDRKSKPRAVKDGKKKEKEIDADDVIEDTTTAQEKIQSKKTTPPATLPTPKSKTNSKNENGTTLELTSKEKR